MVQVLTLAMSTFSENVVFSELLCYADRGIGVHRCGGGRGFISHEVSRKLNHYDVPSYQTGVDNSRNVLSVSTTVC